MIHLLRNRWYFCVLLLLVGWFSYYSYCQEPEFLCQLDEPEHGPSPTDHPNCRFLSKDDDVVIEGFLFLDSKQNIFLEFEDSLFNGKLKLLSDKEMYESIYRMYDSYLSFKNPEDGPFRVSIYGHYMEVGITEWPWPHRRREFYVHQIGFLGE